MIYDFDMFLICIPIPVQNDGTRNEMNKTKLENGRGVILGRSGRPFYSGKLDVGHSLTIFYFWKT